MQNRIPRRDSPRKGRVAHAGRLCRGCAGRGRRRGFQNANGGNSSGIADAARGIESADGDHLEKFGGDGGMSWEKTTIGKHCEITSSKRIFFSDYTDHGIPFFRSKEIIEMVQHKDISESLFISQEKYDEIAYKFGVPSAGDLLLTSVGTIGIPYIIKESDHFYFKDGNLTWFRNFDTGLLSAFLYYWFLSDEGIGVLNNSTIGSSQKALTISNIKKIQIPLFPLNIQSKIVSILSAYDSLIENNQKQIKLLEEAAQRLYKEWFVDLRFPGWENTKIVDGVPEGWEKTTFGHICTVKKHIINIQENILDGYYLSF